MASKYTDGKPIRTIETLLKQRCIRFHGMTLNIAFVKGWHLAFIERNLKQGNIRFAKEKRNGK